MRTLRRIQKSIKRYQFLLNEDIEHAKSNSKEYLKYVTELEEYLEYYIEDAAEEFQRWADISVTNFFKSSKNIILIVKRKIDMIIINHYLNKISGELAVAGQCQEKLKRIKERFIQFEYLTN